MSSCSPVSSCRRAARASSPRSWRTKPATSYSDTWRASTAAMLGAVLIGLASHGNPGGGEAMEGAMAMAQATAFQKSINFTRGEESEADYVGIQLLAAAGFDPLEMANMFETLSQSEGLEGTEIPAILQNHPVTP